LEDEAGKAAALRACLCVCVLVLPSLPPPRLLFRYEASRIPDVMISHSVDQRKYAHLQTDYMPRTQTVSKCHDALLPDGEWAAGVARDFERARKVRGGFRFAPSAWGESQGVHACLRPPPHAL
jgi:hypothetical protein